MTSDRLFVAQIVMVMEDQWFAPNTDGPPIRLMRRFAIESVVFAALDEEDAFRIVSGWLEHDAFTDANHDGPGDLMQISARGIHQLEEVPRLAQWEQKTRDSYGITLPSFYLGDIDSQGAPSVREKQDLEVFRLLRLLGQQPGTT
jgi:hypothetical protein